MREHQQAYDRGITIFSPDGRLYQVEYARAAVENGEPVVGVCGANTVALAAHAPTRSTLVEDASIEKLHRIDDRIAVANAGHAADGRQLVDIGRQAAQTERLRFGEPATVDHLSTVIADHIQEHTQAGGSRPYGTGLLIAGVDDEPRLTEIDPSGATSTWQADAVGRDAGEITAFFEERYEPERSEHEALTLALQGLECVIDEVSPSALDAVVVRSDGYESVGDEALAERLSEESDP